MNNREIIVLDGHDAVGKTSIGNLLAKQFNGLYLRPFEGEYGHQLIEFAEKEDFDDLIVFVKNRFSSLYQSHSNQTLIFDRHWMTVLSLLPSSYWKDWKDFPTTFLLTANLETIKHRLSQRKEKLFTDDYHLNYLKIYKELATQFNVPILNSDHRTPEEIVQQIRGLLV
mgnify:CR=1 FL=1